MTSGMVSSASSAALGLLRRGRHGRVRPVLCRICPDCGWHIRDRDAARLGFCDLCREFTGMCGAGRRIVCPDVMTITTWHTPCTRLGAEAWEITLVKGSHRTLLCETHDTQMRSREMPWVELAVPLRR
jgi:hypothetical protein